MVQRSYITCQRQLVRCRERTFKPKMWAWPPCKVLCNDLLDGEKVRSIKQRKEFRTRKLEVSPFMKSTLCYFYQLGLHLAARKNKN